MSAREWKPGDVAAVTWRRGDDKTEDLIGMRLNGGDWQTTVGQVDGDSGWTNARPLVVIDPEDREQVEVLLTAWLDADDHDQPTVHGVTVMQDVLRALANPQPPKPDEPTGLGAVVEDGGDEYVHFGNGCWIKSVPNADLYQRPWTAMSPAVKVLSPGVTP